MNSSDTKNFFFETLTTVIFEPNTSSRLSIRKSLIELGVKGSNIFIATTYHELAEYIKINAPHFVLTVDHTGKDNCLDLIDKHIEVVPDRTKSGFVVISNYNSIVTKSEVAEYEIDFVVTKPFNQKEFMDQMLCHLEHKINPSELVVIIESGKMALYKGEYDRAVKYFQKAVERESNNLIARYYLALSNQKIGNVDDAIVNYKKALLIDPCHFKSLIALFDIYYEYHKYDLSLSYARRLMKNNSINPRRISQFIKLAIATKSYRDIIYYCDHAGDVVFDEDMEKYLAAGLAVGAKQLIANENDLELAGLCLKHASKYCLKFPKIALSVIESMIDIDSIDEADDLLFKLINEEGHRTFESYLLEMNILFHKKDYAKALLLGLNLLKQGNKESKLYECIIRSSIKINRNSSFVTEMYQDGVKRFPELSKLSPIVDEFMTLNNDE